jgi:CubicO group peptidase (beta-lactamase class C family)
MSGTRVLLILILLLIGTPSRAEEPSSTVVGAAGRELDREITALASNGFNGVVLVSRNGKIILAKGYGMADREKHLPFTATTIVDTASITKQFTAAGILKLESQAKLKVTDTLSTFFPEAPAETRDITIKQLLTHYSGLAAYLGDDYLDPYLKEPFIRLAINSQLRTKPGEEFGYSNPAYSLLAAIIEKISGEPYENFLSKHFFEPAGMMHTGSVLPDWRGSVMAIGYDKDGKSLGAPADRPWASDGPYWHLRGNGGILTTVGDMNRWNGFIESGRALPPKQLAEFLTPHVKADHGDSYAYGWFVRTHPDLGTIVEHSGGSDSFASMYSRYPQGLMIFWSTNSRVDRNRTFKALNGKRFHDYLAALVLRAKSER